MTSNMAERSNPRYDPLADAQERWPGWQVRIADLTCSAVIVPGCRMILIDRAAEDPQMEVAYAIAHLDLHLDEMGDEFTAEQEERAETLAAIRLDREGWR